MESNKDDFYIGSSEGETAVTVSPGENKTNLNHLDTLKVGQLTDDQMKRFKLGPYSKTSTPGSVSV